MNVYLLYCSNCDEYTSLGKYIPENRCFEGEYSLLHNKHTKDSELLCKFLIEHLGHGLKMVQNQTEEFTQIICGSHCFLDHEIDAYVLESNQRLLHFEEESKRTRGYNRDEPILGEMKKHDPIHH
jgi:hypothetical protein